MEYITLLGSEDVSRAGHNMSTAAQEFGRQVDYLRDVLEQHQRWMDQWLQEFRVVLEESAGE